MAMPSTQAPEDVWISATNGSGRSRYPDEAASKSFSRLGSASPREDQIALRMRSRRRKLVRAQQACTRCRKKKAKCNGAMPVCSRCMEYGARCVYDRLLPADRTLEDIDKISDDVEQLNNATASLAEQVKMLYRLVESRRPSQPLPMPAQSHLRQNRSFSDRGTSSISSPGLTMAEDITKLKRHPLRRTNNGFPEISHITDGTSSFSMSHGRLSSMDKLLAHWPAISAFYESSGSVLSVLQTEQGREPVAFLGKVYCKNGPVKSPTAVDRCEERTMISALADNCSNFVSVWDICHRGSPTNVARTPYDLWDSYLKHVHIFFPFLDVKHASKLVDAVKGTGASSAIFSNTSSSSMSATTSFHMRRLTPGEHQRLNGTEHFLGYENGYTEFQIESGTQQEDNWVQVLDEAEVLLIFALGLLSESDLAARSGNNPPGIEFYARAAGILGIFTGSSELKYVQSLLLAGIYASQLVRPLESWRWVNSASVTMNVLLMQTPMVMDPIRSDPDLDAIRLTFWACYELENDLVAELGLPQSNISHYAERIPLPNETPERREDVQLADMVPRKVIDYYREQIKLLKLVNHIRSSVFAGEQSQPKGRPYHCPNDKRLMARLRSWRDHLPATFAWSDHEAPASNVNDARLRAIYYQACHILHRPQLHWAVHGFTEISPPGDVQQSGRNSDTCERKRSSASDSNSERPAQAAVDPEAILGARSCLKAAAKSIEAFDKVIGISCRLATANVFGAMQAQFSNLLVFSAAFQSTEVSHLVQREHLQQLLERTVALLSTAGSLSPTIQRNLVVLDEVKTQLGF